MPKTNSFKATVTNNNMKKSLSIILCLLLGASFITIATLKLIHIDEIETALYGTYNLSLCATAFLTRASIFLNLLTGLSGLLWPVWKLIKSRTQRPLRWLRALMLILPPLVALVVPFGCVPMDGLYNRFVPQTRNSLDPSAFAELKADSAVQTLGIDTGTCVVGVFSTGCYYCRLSATKVNYLMNRCKLPTNKFKMIFIGSPSGIEGFQRLTGTGSYPHVAVNEAYTLNAIRGTFPTFILMKNGQVAGVYDFRGLNEKEWNELLSPSL